MALPGSRNNNHQKQEQEQRYEILHPLTKAVLMSYQIIQTLALLATIALYVWGPTSWIANVMPSMGTFTVLVLAFALFVFLWIKRIKVLSNAK